MEACTCHVDQPANRLAATLEMTQRNSARACTVWRDASVLLVTSEMVGGVNNYHGVFPIALILLGEQIFYVMLCPFKVRSVWLPRNAHVMWMDWNTHQEPCLRNIAKIGMNNIPSINIYKDACLQSIVWLLIFNTSVFSTCIAGEFECVGEPCKEIECAEDEFLCFDAQKCVNYEQVCDSIMDCFDGSDEMNCSKWLQKVFWYCIIEITHK